jgi:hypothetical protein
MIKKFLQDKRLETWLWESFNALLVISIAILADIDWYYAPIVIAVLNQITKYLNVKFIK